MLTREDIRRESMRIVRQDYQLSRMTKVLKAGYVLHMLSPSAVGLAVGEVTGHAPKPLPRFEKA